MMPRWVELAALAAMAATGAASVAISMVTNNGTLAVCGAVVLVLGALDPLEIRTQRGAK